MPLRTARAQPKLRCNCIANKAPMKTATLPSLRVDSATREAAESVLREGETLSGFVLEAIEQAFAFLGSFPFACRKASDSQPFLRKIVIEFGHAG